MKIFNQLSLIFALISLLTSCSSMERHTYFKVDDESVTSNKEDCANPSSRVTIYKDLLLIPTNTASKTYAVGPLIFPVLPVFFMSSYQSPFKTDEKIELSYFVSWLFDSKVGSLDKIKFTPPVIELPSGQRYAPEQIEYLKNWESRVYQVKYTYGLKVKSIDRFKVLRSSLVPPDQGLVKTPQITFSKTNKFRFFGCNRFAP